MVKLELEKLGQMVKLELETLEQSVKLELVIQEQLIVKPELEKLELDLSLLMFKLQGMMG